MFFQNRAKNSFLKVGGSSTDRERSLGIQSQKYPESTKNSSSSALYQTILESQAMLFNKSKPFTPSKRLSVMKRDYKKHKTQESNRVVPKQEEFKDEKDIVRYPTPKNIHESPDKKQDKIKELFIQIIQDQDEGIKSPSDLSSSYRKKRRKMVGQISSKEKDNSSLLLPNVRLSNFTNLKHLFGETKNSIVLSSDRKYKFLSYDSKFEEIVTLKKNNELLKKEMRNLQNELLGKNDLIHTPLRKSDNPLEILQEKRVTILKNQLTKQKRYIKSLHKSLRLMKKFYRDMTSILLLFKNLDGKYAEMMKNNEKMLYKKPRNIIRNDISLLKELDEKQKSDTLQQILHGTKNAELLEKFLSNFNEAYEKVKNFERKNEELKKMFDITDADLAKDYKEKAKKIKYNYLLREFYQKYNKFFPIKTFFDLMEPKDKDTIDTQVTKIIKLMEKIEEVFQQISSFDKINKNEFYSQLSVPESLKENVSAFEGFLNGNQKSRNISLNYQTISSVESSLVSLMRELANFQISLATNSQETLNLEKIMNLQKSLRENVEKLLEMGVFLTEIDDPLTLLQNEAGCSLNTIVNEKKNLEPLPFKKNLYKGESTCNNDFQKIYSFLQESLNDIEESVTSNLDEMTKRKLHSFKFYLITLNRLYEQKKITSFLKDLDLSMQSQRIDLINRGFDSLKMEIFEKIKSFEDFFQNMNEKVGKLGQSFDLIFENVNEDKKKVVLEHSKKVQNLFKFMALNIEKRMGQKEFNEMNLNLASLEEEYKVKVKVIEDKWNSFTKRIKNILDILNETPK